MDDRFEKLHIYLCIFAALVVTAVCIFRNENLYRMSLFVSFSIIIFYVVGQAFRLYLVHKVFFKQEKSVAVETAVERMDEVEFSDDDDFLAEAFETEDN